MSNILRKLILGRKESRQPFMKPPLAIPGESLREKLDDELFGFALALYIPFLLFLLVVYKTIFSAPLSHLLSFWVYMITSLPVLLVAILYGRRKIRKILTYRQGFMGEQIIGQELERSRSMGYVVFHDIYNEQKKFNVDHIAIGKPGIVVVETKSKSKLKKGSPEIVYDGTRLTFPDRTYTMDPLDQVEANAKWIQELAHKLIAEKKNAKCQFNNKNPVPVVRIVVYPGWYVDYEEARKVKAKTMVTNDEMLVDNVIKSLKQPLELTDGMITELQELFEYYLREKNKEMIEY